MNKEQIQWLYEFNKFVVDRLENIDDDTFIQIGIVEKYLSAYGMLPTKENDLKRLYKAVEIYIKATQEIGIFPS